MSNQREEAPKITSFNGRLSKDGSGEFPVEKGRYHLYLAPGCPYAQRVLIMRKLKRLEDVISLNLTHCYIHKKGWFFDETEDQCTKDSINRFKFLREAYYLTNPDYSDKIAVPVLYDNNESVEIMEIFNSDFNDFCPTQEQKELNLFPKEYEESGKKLLSWITPHIIRGVYRAGHSTSQDDYEIAIDDLFQHLDKLEDHLSKYRYLTGNTIIHEDIKLFVTLVRFDIAYYVVLKLSYRKQKPTGVCPRGPIVDFIISHGREALISP